MSVNLPQLRAFVAVIDAGGFGAAAPVLGITQSAVSHAVAALEKTVGAPVLIRGPAPRPTAVGNQVLVHARAALAAADAIGDLAAAQHNSPRGVVRIAAPPSVCQGLMPTLVAEWAERFPRVSIRVFEGEDDEVDEWLSSRTVDAAVLVDPPRSLPGTLIATDVFHALVRADHPLANEAAIDLADLEDDPLLFSGGSCEQPIKDLYRREGLHLRPTHRVRELSTLFSMVRSGLGVAVLPSLVRAMLDETLVLVPLLRTERRRLFLTGPTSEPWRSTVSALIDAIDHERTY